jgi:HEAT repeat protein
MTTDAEWFARLAPFVVAAAALLAATMVGAVAVERAAFAVQELRRRRFAAHVIPIIEDALAGDTAAAAALAAASLSRRVAAATWLMQPLVGDRDPDRIERARTLVRTLALRDYAVRMARSRRWWRRAFALRAVGLLRIPGYTGLLVAALDDGHAYVRGAALDALGDLRDPASLHAVVVRLLDASLPRGRRVAALAAFGEDAEPILRDLSEHHRAYRVAYARALALCGTRLSIPTLCRWTADGRAAVRTAAFDALARIGLDDRAARLALDALDRSADPAERAAAAHALHHWTGAGDTAARLARHLDDAWIVAAQAARTLQTIRPAGIDALRAEAGRQDLAGTLARQMLWEIQVSA